MFDLTNKTAFVTGATGGIGMAIADVFYKNGANLILTATNIQKLEDLKKKLGNDRIDIIQSDISNKASLNSLIDAVNNINDGPDIVVCNAGITRDALSIRIKEEDWDSVMDVNLKAVFLMNKGFYKGMSKRKWGRVINISSVVAFTGNVGQANYSAAKGAIVSLTKTMALEFAKKNITYNCIAPGFIETRMTDAISQEYREKIFSHIPAGHIGDPMDVAYGALYLASNEAGYVTGHSLHINGGMFMN